MELDEPTIEAPIEDDKLANAIEDSRKNLTTDLTAEDIKNRKHTRE